MSRNKKKSVKLTPTKWGKHVPCAQIHYYKYIHIISYGKGIIPQLLRRGNE